MQPYKNEINYGGVKRKRPRGECGDVELEVMGCLLLEMLREDLKVSFR